MNRNIFIYISFSPPHHGPNVLTRQFSWSDWDDWRSMNFEQYCIVYNVYLLLWWNDTRWRYGNEEIWTIILCLFIPLNILIYYRLGYIIIDGIKQYLADLKISKKKHVIFELADYRITVTLFPRKYNILWNIIIILCNII